MAGLSVPNDNTVSPVWRQFFNAIARKFSAVGNVATVSTANASDPATTQALVNELKAKVNELIGAQQS